MSELFTPPAAGFDHPLDILDGCHHRVRRFCALIERIAAHLEEAGADEEARVAAGSALRYFDVAGRDHHLDEEEDLFPALICASATHNRANVTSLVSRLKADHQVLDAMWRAVRHQLVALRDGLGTRVDTDLARRFAHAYADHIAEEESLLLPLARRLLAAEALARLGASMAARRGAKGTVP